MRKETLFFLRAILFQVTWSAMGLLAVLFLTKAWHKSHPHSAIAAKSANAVSHSASAVRVR